MFLRRQAHYTKNDPLVDEVELIEANPQYALVRHADGRESNVSLRDLAPPRDILGLWMSPKDRPTPPDTEALPEDHGTEIAPNMSSNDTVSVKSPNNPIPLLIILNLNSEHSSVQQLFCFSQGKFVYYRSYEWTYLQTKFAIYMSFYER